jgi:hypothetical protein
LFGWEEPDDTDLVKDGAAAIRTLGNAIDTSMGDLLGGTTGQILSKNSNSNMDFTWITNDVGDITAVTAGTGISGGGTSGAVTITNSMATTITTAGDLIKGTGSGTFDRLGIGTTGQVLTVSGGAPVWATPSGGGGKVLQVVQATTTTGLNTSSTSYQNTSLSASITPSATTSKVLVIAMQVATIQASDRRSIHTLFRGDNTGTDLSSGATDGMTTASNQTGGSSNYPFSMQYLDSPSTTSSTTYTACMKTDGGGQCGVRANTMQVMILMEIGA